METLKLSAYISVAIQFITGLIEAQGLTLAIPNDDLILQDILSIELIIQGIEFLFYIYLVWLIVTNKLNSSITTHRYIDWSITTPTMLISFILFFKYLKEPDREIRWKQSFQEEFPNIRNVLLANACMLGLGFLAEIGTIPTALGVAIGFLPFAYMFQILYAQYAQYTQLGRFVYYFSFIIWGLYGVAAVLPFAQKNTMYNILDLFSKNAYGLFLYGYIRTKQISS